MAQRRITPLSFNRPQSTHVPFPIEEFTQAGSALQGRYLQNQAQVDLIDDMISNINRIPGADENALNLAAEAARQRIAEINDAGDFEHAARRVRRLASDVARNPALRRIRENAQAYENFVKMGQERVKAGQISADFFERSKKYALEDFENSGGSFDAQGNLHTFEASQPVMANLQDEAMNIAKNLPILTSGDARIEQDKETGLWVVRTSSGQRRLESVIEDAVRNGFAGNQRVQSFLAQEQAFADRGDPNTVGRDELMRRAVEFAKDFAVSGGVEGLQVISGQFNKSGNTNPSLLFTREGRERINSNVIPDMNDITLPNETTIGQDVATEFKAGWAGIAAWAEREAELFAEWAANQVAKDPGNNNEATLRDDSSAADAFLRAYNDYKKNETLNLAEYDGMEEWFAAEGVDRINEKYKGLPDLYEEVKLMNPNASKDQLENAAIQLYRQKALALKNNAGETRQVAGEGQIKDFTNSLIGEPNSGTFGVFESATYFPQTIEQAETLGLSPDLTMDDVVDKLDFEDMSELKKSATISDIRVPFTGPGEFIMNIRNGEKSIALNVQTNSPTIQPVSQAMQKIGQVLTKGDKRLDGLNLTAVYPDANYPMSVVGIDLINSYKTSKEPTNTASAGQAEHLMQMNFDGRTAFAFPTGHPQAERLMQMSNAELTRQMYDKNSMLHQLVNNGIIRTIDEAKDEYYRAMMTAYPIKPAKK